MANTIALRKQYSTLLDEIYKLASLTAVLDGPNELVKEGANANEILIPKMSMQGLANYNKQTGYVAGDVTLEYETKKCGYDRGRMFTIDAMDNIESAGVAFGRLSAEFLRTQVVPELDLPDMRLLMAWQLWKQRLTPARMHWRRSERREVRSRMQKRTLQPVICLSIRRCSE